MRAWSISLGLAALAAAPAAHAQLVDYTVRPGDSCVAIARRRYRNPRRIDLIHQHNDLGPLPHRLRPGSVLRIPLRVPADAPAGPDARLTFVRNVVETYTPSQARGRRNDPLSRGNRVNTLGDASAEVTFADETQLQLGEHTLVVILGDTESQARATRRTGVADTTLVSGALRARLGELAGRRPIATAGGAQVVVNTGEAHIAVTPARETRVSVHGGRSQLTSARRSVTVNAGFGARAEAGRPPSPPQPLPPAPVWSAEPPALVLLASGDEARGALAGRFAPGRGAGPAAAQWHLQLARDRAFNDLVLDARVGASVTELEARNLVAGAYYAHVAAIDAQGFEGLWGPEAAVRVARPAVSAVDGAAFRARVAPPEGTLCALDDGALSAQPLEYDALAAHILRCAPEGATTRAATLALAPVDPGALTARATLEPDPNAPRSGRVALSLSFGAGGVFPQLPVAARAPEGVTLGELQPGPQPGTFDAAVQCAEGARSFRLHVLVGVRFEADSNELACPQPAPVEPAPSAVPSAAVPAPSAPTTPARPQGHPLLLGREPEWGVSLRAWALRIPSTFVGLFTNLQPGWTGYTGLVAGPELLYRHDNTTIVLGAMYTSYGAEPFAAQPFAVRGRNEPVEVQEILTARLWATYVTGSILWGLRPHRMFEVQIGIGLGAGYIGGDLFRTQAFPAGPTTGGYRDQSGAWRDCERAGGPGGTQGFYCNPADSSPPHFSNGAPTNPDVAYREPTWANAGSVPIFLPWVSLPQVSLHFRPTRHFSMRGDVGFAGLGYYSGGALQFFF